MKLLAFLLALLLLAATAAPTEAGWLYSPTAHCGYQWYGGQYYGGVWFRAGHYKFVSAHHVEQAHVSHSLSYDSEADKLLKVIDKQQETIKALLDRIPGAAQSDTAPEKKAVALDAAGILKTRCVECHAPAAAEKKGGSIELFDATGELLDYSKAERARMIRYVTSTDPAKRCPKKGPLVASEKKTLVDWLKVEPAAAAKE